MLEQLKTQVCRANLDLVNEGLVLQTWGNVSGIDRDKGLNGDFAMFGTFNIVMLVRTRIEALPGAPAGFPGSLHGFVVVALHIDGTTERNNGYVGQTRYGKVLLAQRDDKWLAVGLAANSRHVARMSCTRRQLYSSNIAARSCSASSYWPRPIAV